MLGSLGGGGFGVGVGGGDVLGGGEGFDGGFDPVQGLAALLVVVGVGQLGDVAAGLALGEGDPVGPDLVAVGVVGVELFDEDDVLEDGSQYLREDEGAELRVGGDESDDVGDGVVDLEDCAVGAVAEIESPDFLVEVVAGFDVE